MLQKIIFGEQTKLLNTIQHNNRDDADHRQPQIRAARACFPAYFFSFNHP
jgi:hypothetical protein